MNDKTDPIALANLISTIVIAFCALYLAYAALKHSAVPKVGVKLSNPSNLAVRCNEKVLFVFEFTNIGHWHAKPTAINVVVFLNFDPEFKLIELRYGSTQEKLTTQVKSGVGRMKYFKAKGIMLAYGEESEDMHVITSTPQTEGEHLIRISAFSENGVSLNQEFRIRCKKASATV